jgi:hypothetical protein
MRRYGRADLADEVRQRWLALNRRIYRATGKMTEKYDVVDLTRPAGGGEYPNQDGFGWTNGVALSLSQQQGRRPVPMRGSWHELAAAGELPVPANGNRVLVRGALR